MCTLSHSLPYVRRRNPFRVVSVASAFSVALAAGAQTAGRGDVSRDDFTRALTRNAAYRKAEGMMPGSAHWIDGGGHGAGGDYGERRLLDFFVRAMSDKTTVNWNATQTSH